MGEMSSKDRTGGRGSPGIASVVPGRPRSASGPFIDLADFRTSHQSLVLRGSLRIFDFDPGFRPTRAVNRCEPLRHDALQSKIAHGLKQFFAVTFGVLDVPHVASELRPSAALRCLLYRRFLAE